MHKQPEHIVKHSITCKLSSPLFRGFTLSGSAMTWTAGLMVRVTVHMSTTVLKSNDHSLASSSSDHCFCTSTYDDGLDHSMYANRNTENLSLSYHGLVNGTSDHYSCMRMYVYKSIEICVLMSMALSIVQVITVADIHTVSKSTEICYLFIMVLSVVSVITTSAHML